MRRWPFPGETAWPVPPLPQPEAISPFTDRVAVAGFRLSPETEPLVAQICHHLDSIPLAIELAATRLKTLSAREIVDRLDDRPGSANTARSGWSSAVTPTRPAPGTPPTSLTSPSSRAGLTGGQRSGPRDPGQGYP